MRIATNTASNAALQQIGSLDTNLSKLQTEISTGQRVSLPEDDPAAVGRLINYQGQSRQLTQFQQNASQALQISQASTSALQSLKSVSDRATEIGTLGSSTESADSAASYATEVNQLIEQAVQSANTQFNNNYLFAGTAVDTTPFQVTRDASGNITAVTYAGNTTTASIPLSSTASISPYSSGATNQGIADFLNNLIALRDALNTNDTTAVASAQNGLLTTENTIINGVSDQGAIQMRIQVNQTQQQNDSTSLQQLISSDADIDMSTAIVKYNQLQVAYQASLQSTAALLSKSLLDYVQ